LIRRLEETAVGERRGEAFSAPDCDVQCRACRWWARLRIGDELGRPGTILTFFAWAGARRGRVGPPQVTATAFAVPMGAIEVWSERLGEKGIEFSAGADRFGERVLSFSDPDGMQLEIVSSMEAVEPGGEPWKLGPVPVEHAIRGFHGATVSEEGHEETAKLLMDVMGFKFIGNEQNRFRYRAGAGNGVAATIDLLCAPDARHGDMGAGVVHHIAFRTADDAQQEAWRKTIAGNGLNVSPVMDRTYFHSIYYREPGGVLFEIATDNPGFTADESAADLGKKLMLPSWLEPHRKAIERSAPPVRLPGRR